MSHLTFSLLMAVLVAGAAAAPGKREAAERAYVATYVFLGCVTSTFAVGWLMHFVHR